jgi:hypothetical protein
MNYFSLFQFLYNSNDEENVSLNKNEFLTENEMDKNYQSCLLRTKGQKRTKQFIMLLTYYQ